MASGSLPLLSPVAASAGSLLVTATYVGSLYLAKSARIPHAASSNSSSEAASSAEEERLRLGRDHPDVIRARLKAVGGATVACCVGVWAVVQLGLGEPTSWLKGLASPSLSAAKATWSLLGFPRLTGFSLSSWSLPTLVSLGAAAGRWLSPLTSPAAPFLLAPVLFLGPLYSDVFLERLRLREAWQALASWTGGRNYVVAPLTEEVVFRSCIIALAQLSGASWSHQVFITPLWFGLAHVHHAFEVFVARGRTRQAALIALATCTFQFAYTTLFGWFAAFLFVKTGSIASPFLSHVFCNTMGLPQPAWAFERHPSKKRETVLAYAVGIVGFICGLVYC